MQTNRRIPALVCLSMIVSGCANEDLFNNWSNADKPEPSNPDMRATDMKASDMAQCSPSCPFTWTEDFSGGHFSKIRVMPAFRSGRPVQRLGFLVIQPIRSNPTRMLLGPYVFAIITIPENVQILTHKS
jgi:hypothetical protein